MSFEHIRWVWTLTLPALERLVLLRLADRANGEGECWPGHESLARDCQLSLRKIILCMRSLERKTLIEPVELSGNRKGYRLASGPVLLAVGPRGGRVHALHRAPHAPCTDAQPELPGMAYPTRAREEGPTKNLPIETTRDQRAREREGGSRESAPAERHRERRRGRA